MTAHNPFVAAFNPTVAAVFTPFAAASAVFAVASAEIPAAADNAAANCAFSSPVRFEALAMAASCCTFNPFNAVQFCICLGVKTENACAKLLIPAALFCAPVASIA